MCWTQYDAQFWARFCNDRGGLWPDLHLGGKQLFVIVVLKCVVSIQLFSRHRLRRSLADLKSYTSCMLDVCSSVAGFIRRNSRKCRWERADQEASATGSYTILQSARFTAPDSQLTTLIVLYLSKSVLLPETFGISYLVKARHQILHGVTSLSTLGRHGGHRQRGLEVWVAFALTLGTAQVSSEETEVVQGKDLHTRAHTHTVWKLSNKLNFNPQM